MISGYNTGGQPVKVPNFLFYPFADIISTFPPETHGDHQEIDQYERFRLS
jgi:hypothetical protein